MKISNSYKLFDIIISLLLTTESFQAFEGFGTPEVHVKNAIMDKTIFHNACLIIFGTGALR